MSIIKRGQPYTLTLDTKTSLAGVTKNVIAYKKPSGTISTVAATVSGTTLISTITGAINNEAGKWAFEAVVRFSGDVTDTTGETFKLDVLNRFTE